MTDPFLDAAGEVPARRPDDRWRQAALLGLRAAVSPAGPASARLAGVLCGLDWPDAARAIAVPDGADPWGRWWAVLASGQDGDLTALHEALSRARAKPCGGPDGREVARRLDDLAAETATLAGASDAGRFQILGHRARPERRFLLVGRSSATFLVAPSWEALSLVRIGPAEAPSAGNGAHRTLAETLELVRRGDAGPGRAVPPDTPPAIGPEALLDALREAPGERDARLLGLAREVREERDRLQEERIRLTRERDAFLAERAAARKRRAQEPPPVAPPATAGVPKTRAAAAAVLGVGASASAKEIERAHRRLVAGTHPDRVAELDPRLRARAEELTVAVNAARDLLLGGRR